MKREYLSREKEIKKRKVKNQKVVKNYYILGKQEHSVQSADKTKAVKT